MLNENPRAGICAITEAGLKSHLRYNLHTVFLIALALGIAANPAAAQPGESDLTVRQDTRVGDGVAGERADDAGPVAVDAEIIVSATRTPQRAETVGSTVTVIDAKTLVERQYSFIADALQDAAGVAVARNGARGGVAGARVRGAASGQTLVVIDGIVVNDPSAPQGGFNFANLDLVDVARIEILRGPQSLLYGADAIGGVIAITTRREAEHPVSAFFEGGSLGTARGGATAFIGSGEALYVRATVSGITTDGVSRAEGGAEPDGYRSLAASLKTGLRLNETWSAEATGRLSDSRADIDGFAPPTFAFGDTLETEDTREIAASTALRHEASRLKGALTLAYADIDRANDDQGFETFAAQGDRLTADYLGDIALGSRARIVGGAEIERTSVIVSGVDEDARSAAVFALIEVEPIAGLVASAGGRRDEFSNFEGATTARAALAYSGVPGYVLRASWGEGFRAPSLFELNYAQFGVTPNPDLRPERSTGFDAGVERSIGGFVARATFFQTRVRDQIGFDLAEFGYFNIDRARARGVETELAFAPSEAFSASLAYTFTDAVNLSTGAALLRQPKHKGTIALSWSPVARLSLSSSLLLNGQEADTPAGNDAFARLDLRAAYRLGERLELYGRVENATDTDYQDVSGYGEPGAAAFGGMRVRL